MKPNEYRQVQAWDKMIRIVVLAFLLLSAFMAFCAAIVISALETSEHANLLRGALLMFAAAAVGCALAFRKSERLTWKHWSVICMLAAPGAVYTLLH